MEDTVMEINVGSSNDSLWDQLKVKLDEELVPDQVKQMRYLMKDKISPEAFSHLQTPSDLLTYLENNMDADDAWTIVEHVFRITQDYFLFETKSIADILRNYRNARAQCTNSSLLGRRDDVRYILEELDKVQCKGVWIHGFGGLGKTSLAREVCATLSVRGSNVTNIDMKYIKSSLNFVRRILELAMKSNVISSDIDVLIDQIHFSETNDRCVLLDNIEDVLTNNYDETIKVLNKCALTSSEKIKWIVTCREPPHRGDVSHLDGRIKVMELKPLDETSSTQLLKLRAKPKTVSNDDITSTLKYTGGIPLFINLVGKQIKDNVALERIVSRIASREIAEILSVTFESLEADVQMKLVELSVVGTSNFDTNVARAVWNIDRKNTVLILMDLTNRHVIQRNDWTTSSNRHENVELNYCIHPLVARCLEGKQVSINMEQAQLNFFIHVFSEIEKDAAKMDVEYEMARSAIQIKGGLCSSMLRMLSSQKFTRARPFSVIECKYLSQLTDVFHISADEKGRLYENVIKNSQKQHFVFWRVEQMAMLIDDKQTSKAEEVLALIEADLSDNECEVDSFTLGVFYYHKGRYFRLMKKFSDALSCQDKASTYFENCDDAVRLAETLNAKGNVYFDNYEYDKAKKAHEDARDVLQSVVNSDHHPDLSTYDFNIGTVCLAYAEQKRRLDNTIDQETRDLYETALNSFIESLQKDQVMGLDKSSQYPIKLDNTAHCYYYLDRMEAAISTMKEYVDIAKSSAVSLSKLIAYFRAGKTFMDWYYDGDKGQNRQLIIEAANCFSNVEIILNDYPNLDLNLENKSTFLRYYRKLIENFPKDRRDSIRYFLERYENNTLRTSNTSSDSSESSAFSPEHSDNLSDDAIGYCSETDDAVNCTGIPITEMEKRESKQFESIHSMFETSKTNKRSHSSSDSD